MRKFLYMLIVCLLAVFIAACQEDKVLKQKNEIYQLLDENKLDAAIAKLKAYKSAFAQDEYYYNLGTTYLQKAGFGVFDFARDLLDMDKNDDNAFTKILVKKMLKDEAKVGLDSLESVFDKENNSSTQCTYLSYKKLASIYQQNACLLINPSLMIYLNKDEKDLSSNQKNTFMSLPKILEFNKAISKTGTIDGKPIGADTLVDIITKKDPNVKIEIDAKNLDATTDLLTSKDTLRAMGQLRFVNDDEASADDKAKAFLKEVCETCNYDNLDKPEYKAKVKKALESYIKGQKS